MKKSKEKIHVFPKLTADERARLDRLERGDTTNFIDFDLDAARKKTSRKKTTKKH